MTQILNNKSNSAFTIALLQWFQENARNLPWRNNPTAYNVWLSEIMLQQTRVAAVIDYYHRFLQELPTIEDLANCPEDKLMKLWQGLGYYNRARNLQKAALQIMETHNGTFPTTYDEIRSLSGIGDYTAGAIASTVYHLPTPAVDGNVLRVITRITANTGDITTGATKKEVTAWVSEHMPTDHVSAYNQALMELGALICLPNGAPLCEKCPVNSQCLSTKDERWKEIPVKKAKKPRTIEALQVFLIFKEDKIALQKRPSKGLLANLWEFPNLPLTENPIKTWNLPLQPPHKIASGKHIFTHKEWHMEGFRINLDKKIETPENWTFLTPQEIKENYAIPSAFSFLSEII